MILLQQDFTQLNEELGMQDSLKEKGFEVRFSDMINIGQIL